MRNERIPKFFYIYFHSSLSKSELYNNYNINLFIDSSLKNCETIENLNSTFQKLLNDTNRLQIQHKKYDSVVRENELLKKKINNLEIQITDFIRK